jgi:lysozyme
VSQPVLSAPGLVRGIDVSQAQGVVAWDEVAASGIRFAYVRAFEGQDLDPTFARNRRAALAAGLLVGAYQYLRARHPGAYQADLLADLLGELGPGELPPALDVETLDDKAQDVPEVQGCVLAWVQRMRGRAYSPLIYTGPVFWSQRLRGQHLGEVAGCPLWIADYRPRPAPEVPQPWTHQTIWQHAGDGQGRCPGVRGWCDLNLAQLADLLTLAVPSDAATAVPLPIDRGWPTSATDTDPPIDATSGVSRS